MNLINNTVINNQEPIQCVSWTCLEIMNLFEQLISYKFDNNMHDHVKNDSLLFCL